MVKENIRIFAISINKQESESDLSYSQESESEVQTTDSPALSSTILVVPNVMLGYLGLYNFLCAK